MTATRPTATIRQPVRRNACRRRTAGHRDAGNLQADRDNRSLYLNNDIWQWSAEIEKSFGRDFVTGIAYVGSAASNIDMPVQNWNNPDPGLGAVQARRPVQFYVDSREPNRLLQLGTVRRLETGTSANYNALQAARREALPQRTDVPRFVQLPEGDCYRIQRQRGSALWQQLHAGSPRSGSRPRALAHRSAVPVRLQSHLGDSPGCATLRASRARSSAAGRSTESFSCSPVCR